MMLNWILFLLCAAPALAGTAAPDEGGAQLGVYLQELDEGLMEKFDFDGDGVLVMGLVAGGGAEKAGIEEGDIILFFDDVGVSGTEDLVEALSKTRPGDKVPVVIWRDGKARTVKVKLGGKKEDVAFFPAPPDKPDAKFFADPNMNKWLSVQEEARPWLGTGLLNLTEQLHAYFQVKHGVLVTEVKKDSPAGKAGLKAGDVIVRFDGESVKESAGIIDLLKDLEKGDEVDVNAVRRGKGKTFTLLLDRMVKPQGDAQTFFHTYPDGNELKFKALKDMDFKFVPPDVPMPPSGFDMSELHKGMKEYQKEMKSLRKELEELRRELRAMKRDRD